MPGTRRAADALLLDAYCTSSGVATASRHEQARHRAATAHPSWAKATAPPRLLDRRFEQAGSHLAYARTVSRVAATSVTGLSLHGRSGHLIADGPRAAPNRPEERRDRLRRWLPLAQVKHALRPAFPRVVGATAADEWRESRSLASTRVARLARVDRCRIASAQLWLVRDPQSMNRGLKLESFRIACRAVPSGCIT
jgi:hypothetical protein